jgi:anti-anti-sigma factor
MSETSTDFPSEILSLSGHQEDDSWVITLAGEADIMCRDAVRDAFAAAAAAACPRIVIDASELTFIDCAGLGVWMAAAAGSGREVWVRSPSRAVRRLVVLAGLGEHWRPLLDGGEARIA